MGSCSINERRRREERSSAGVISEAYESSQNCMFELAETCKLANKPIVTPSTDANPIVTLSTDANPFAWTGQNTTHGDLKQNVWHQRPRKAVLRHPRYILDLARLG